MPIMEYRCEKCDNIDERLEFGTEMDEEHYCSKCNGLASRIVSKCKFELKYNNKVDCCDWNGNSSHYWDAYKKAREDGQDVKPSGED